MAALYTAVLLFFGAQILIINGQEQCYGVNSGFDLSPGQNDLMNKWNMELGDCCAFCKRTPGCKAFVWGKVLRICYLKYAVGAKRADGNKVYGFPDASQDASDQCSAVTSGLDYSPGSHDIGFLPRTDLGGCCNYCKQTAACKAFIWSKSSTQCWLKDVDSPRVGSGDRVSGTRGGAVIPPVTQEPVTEGPVTPAPTTCGTTADYENSSPNLNCYDSCPISDDAACQCCKSKGSRGGKCFSGVPYCFP